MRTRSPSSNSWGMTVLSLHAFIYAWYLFSAVKARTQYPSVRSLEVDSSTSGVAVELAHGDPCLVLAASLLQIRTSSEKV
jgi:hypothetical protein